MMFKAIAGEALVFGLTRENTEIRRRRACPECGRRFTTRERVDDVLLRVIKRDQRREEYQSQSSHDHPHPPSAKRKAT